MNVDPVTIPVKLALVPLISNRLETPTTFKFWVVVCPVTVKLTADTAVPTFKFLAIPTPPDIINAPDVAFVESTEELKVEIPVT